jgi:hypothetical protein
MIDPDETEQNSAPHRNDDDSDGPPSEPPDLGKGRAERHSLVLRLIEPTDAKNQPARKRGLLAQAQLVGAMVGLAGGLAAAVSGSLLTAASWFTSNADAQQWLSAAGSMLLCLTIPLIILGAFCMDWVEKKRTQHRLKVVRDNGEEDHER